MELIRKNLFFILSGAGIIAAFLFTRLYQLSNLPIFTDEAIYTRWAQIARYDASWRFISLTDGKQPSFVWAQMVMMKFINDPLLAGRMVSVVAGLLTMLGIFFLTREVFKNNKIAIVAALIFALYPFAIVYDRMALYESMMSMFFVWALFLQILLVRTLRLDIALLLGMVLSGAVLTKSSGFLAIYLMPVLILLFPFYKKNKWSDLLKLVGLLALSAGMANAAYLMLRLSPFYHIVEEKNTIFIYPVSEWLKFKNMDKVGNFISNMRGLLDWFWIYFTIPFIGLVVWSFVSGKRLLGEKILLTLWFLLPLLALGVFGKTIYPRYVLLMTLSLIPLVAYSLYSLSVKFKKLWIIVLLSAFVFAWPLWTDYYVLTDIARSPIPRLDKDQLINGWPAGGGIKKSIAFFEKEAKKGKIFVATQGTFGLMPAAYEIYLRDNPNITVVGYWPTDSIIPNDVWDKANEMPTYFVFYQDCPSCPFPGTAPVSWPLRKLFSYQKGIGTTTLTVYEVIKR